MKFSLGLISTLSITVLLSACGGSSSSSSNPVVPEDVKPPETTTPETTTPDAEVTEACGSNISMLFPLKYSATLSKNITIRGKSSCASIDSLVINGVNAVTTNSFANWQANITLTPGLNNIAAVVKEGDKNHDVALGSIESNELFNNPNDMALSSDGSTLYIVDTSRRQILKVNRETGERSVLSSTTFPNKDLYFGNLSGLALNEAEGLLYVGSRYVAGVDGGSKAWILTVNTTTGERQVLVDPLSTDYTPLIETVNQLVLDSAKQKLYAAIQGKVYSIELNPAGTVGEQTLISSKTVPNTVNPISTVGNLTMALDIANERLIVADDGNGEPPQLLAVDLSTANLGNRSIISNENSSGTSWDRPSTLVMVDSSYAYVTDDRSSNLNDVDIIKVSLSSGSREIVHNGSINADKAFVGEHRMVFDSTRQQLLISNESTNALFSVNLSNFDQQTVAYNLNPAVVGSKNLEDIKRSAIDAANQTLYYQSENTDILSFDLRTLKHSSFAKVSGSLNGYNAIDSMSYDDVTKAVIVTGEFNENAHVRSYSVASSGTESIISDDATGTGDDLNEIWDWVRLNETTAIIADDTLSPTKFYELDMATGNRILINVDYTGMPNNLEAEDIAISADKKTLYFVDDSSSAGLYALDLTSKTFTTITNTTLPADGNNLRLNDPESLELSSDGLSAYVGDNSESYLIKINLATGAREGLIGDEIRSTNSWAERINGISVDTTSMVLYTTDTSTDVILMVDEVTNEWVMIAE